jgi:four helix bundle protein
MGGEIGMARTTYRELIVWQKAMDFVELVYHATARFPKEELYGLTSQLRRGAVSIPSNIAEGQGRETRNEFRRFLSIAYGSLREVETQIMIAERLRYLVETKSSQLLTSAGEIGRLLNGLSTSLSRGS